MKVKWVPELANSNNSASPPGKLKMVDGIDRQVKDDDDW